MIARVFSFCRTVATCVTVFGMCQAAQAGIIGWTPWVQFPLAGLHAGQSATVAEQIRAYKDCVGCPVYYDYDYRVKNTSAPGKILDGFGLGVGVGAFGPVLFEHYAFVNGGGDGPWPNIVDAFRNDGIPFLGGTPFLGGAVAGSTLKITNGWGFEEFDNRGGPGGLTAYAARFYAPVQGVGNGFAPGQARRFDLFSFFGPVPGTGGVDPFASGDFFMLDLDGIDNSFSGALETPDLNVCSANCTPGGPPDAPAGFEGILEGTPEPGTVILMGTGVCALVFLSRRRYRQGAPDRLAQ
jgi:hypothetical protein